MISRKTRAGKPRAVIIITLDALRADHAGCYGYPLNTTPALDALAAESLLFEYAFSPIGLTAPSHASLLTGKYPRWHSIGFHNGDKLLNREQETTLPIILKSLGYDTAAFVSIMALLRKISGLDPGFDTYDDNITHAELNRPQEFRRDADQTTSAVMSWLDEHRKDPFFLWVHYSEPHGPYAPPAPYDSMFVGSSCYGQPRMLEKVSDYEQGGIPAYQVLKPQRLDDGQLLNYERDFRYYVSQYDGSVRFADQQLKLLIQRLQELDLYNDTMLIVTADHGESLGENDIYFFHSLTVTLEQIRVPFIVKMPLQDGLAARKITTPVASVDIMPTVLARCGLEARYLGLQGTDLLPMLDGTSVWPERYIFSEIPCQLSVVNGPLQLLYGKGKEASKLDPYPPYVEATDGVSLFDYHSDPRGQKDLSRNSPDTTDKLLRAAEQYLRVPMPKYEKVTRGGLSVEEAATVKSRLAQLGYLVSEELREMSTDDALAKERAENELTKAQLRGVYSSYSWRLTAPLRRVTRAIGFGGSSHKS